MLSPHPLPMLAVRKQTRLILQCCFCIAKAAYLVWEASWRPFFNCVHGKGCPLVFGNPDGSMKPLRDAHLDSPRPSHCMASPGVLPWPRAETSGLWPGLPALTHGAGMRLGPWHFLHTVRRAHLRQPQRAPKKISCNSSVSLNSQSVSNCP